MGVPHYLVACMRSVPDAHLSIGSKTTYEERFECMTKAADMPLEWCLLNPSETWEALQCFRYTKGGKACPLSPQTMLLSATAMVALFKHIPYLDRKFPTKAQWQALHESVYEEAVGKYEDQSPSERQKDVHITWGEIVAKRDELELQLGVPLGAKMGRDKDHDALLLLGLHTYMPPCRRDWGSVRVFEAGRDELPTPESDLEVEFPNYIVLEKDGRSITVVRCKYKTSRTKGRYERSIPDKLCDIIRKSLDARPRHWLVCKNRGEPYVRNSYGKHVTIMLNKLFGRPATVDTLRHSYVNHFFEGDPTPRQIRQLAEDMQSSESIIIRYRLRL